MNKVMDMLETLENILKIGNFYLGGKNADIRSCLALVAQIQDHIEAEKLEKKVDLAEWLLEKHRGSLGGDVSKIHQWHTALKEELLLLHELL